MTAVSVTSVVVPAEVVGISRAVGMPSRIGACAGSVVMVVMVVVT